MTTVPPRACFEAFQAQHSLRRCLVNGQVWEYIESGSGEPLLLLPGFFGVAETCFLYFLAFEHEYRVIALTYPEAATTIAELVEGLAGFMDALGLARAHMLGGSYSGYVAQVFVRHHPQYVKTLLLAQTGAPRRRHLALAFTLASLAGILPPTLSRWLMRQSIPCFLPNAGPAQAFWRSYFQDLIQTQPHRALAHRFQVVLDYHQHYAFLIEDIASWSGAILILESADETLFAPDDVEILRQLYPQARHMLVPGDHTHAVDQPEAQIASLREFLRAVTGVSACES